MVFHIADDHFAETFRIFVLRTTQKNDFIAQNGSGILLDIVFRDVVGRIGLEARDKIHTGEIPFIQHETTMLSRGSSIRLALFTS